MKGKRAGRTLDRFYAAAVALQPAPHRARLPQEVDAVWWHPHPAAAARLRRAAQRDSAGAAAAPRRRVGVARRCARGEPPQRSADERAQRERVRADRADRARCRRDLHLRDAGALRR
eukprot:4217274-Prymnesium_polylepis.1